MNIWRCEWLSKMLQPSVEARLKALEYSHASEEELQDMLADRDYWRDTCAKEKIETEKWKMRADNKTEQYHYWLNIASQLPLAPEKVVQLNKQVQQERSGLTRKVDEMEKRMEDQAKEIEGLKNDLKQLKE